MARSSRFAGSQSTLLFPVIATRFTQCIDERQRVRDVQGMQRESKRKNSEYECPIDEF